MIIGLNKRNPQVFDPYRLNLETGEMTMVAENPGNITGWMTDHDGKLRIAFVTDGVNQSIMHRATEEDDWANVITTNFKQSVSPRFFTFDNQNIYATSNVGRDKEAAIILDLSNGEEIEVLYENETNDVSGLMYSRKDKKIIGASYYTDKAGRHYFDEASKARYDRLTKELEGYEVAITGYTKAEDKFMMPK